MYCIRRLSKPSSENKLKDIELVRDLDADFLHQELRTSTNQLSVWCFDEIGSEEYDCALKCALFSSNELSKTKLIILDQNRLVHEGIEIDNTERGTTGYKGYENLHANLSNLTYEKIGVFARLLKESCESESRVVSIAKSEFEEIAVQLDNDCLIDYDNLGDHLRSGVEKAVKKARLACSQDSINLDKEY